MQQLSVDDLDYDYQIEKMCHPENFSEDYLEEEN